ncbi:hypothetical protein ACHAXS_011727 [Conticribra weissflogii]
MNSVNNQESPCPLNPPDSKVSEEDVTNKPPKFAPTWRFSKVALDVASPGIKRKWDQMINKIKISGIKQENDPFLFYSIDASKRNSEEEIVPSEVRKTRLSTERHSSLILEGQLDDDSDSDSDGNENGCGCEVDIADLGYEDDLSFFEAAEELLDNMPETNSNMTYGQLRQMLRRWQE